MKALLAIPVVLLALTAGCGGGSEPEEPRERLDKPYADKVKEIEQQDLQRVEDQKKAIDEQLSRRRSEDGSDKGGN